MAILSTGQSIKSTGFKTTSNYTGKQMSGDMSDGNPHPVAPSNNPGAHPCKPETNQNPIGDGGSAHVPGYSAQAFRPSDAAHEPMNQWP